MLVRVGVGVVGHVISCQRPWLGRVAERGGEAGWVEGGFFGVEARARGPV